MPGICKAFVPTEKRVAASVGRSGTKFKLAYVVKEQRDGKRLKTFQTPIQAKQAIDIEVASRNQDA